jgi:hypothetical protein
MEAFNLLALISAGHLTEDDNTLCTMQNISQENAHAIGRWMALATGGPVELRLIGFTGTEEIHYTPAQVREAMEEPPQPDYDKKHGAQR